MKPRKASIFAIFFLSSGLMFGQEATYHKFPAQISFVYPLGTSGQRSVDYIYNFSLNALVGSTGGIEGCEIGGLLNMNKSSMSGFQAGGLGNITLGNVEGMQVGGLFSLADHMRGLQVNGIFSKSNETNGSQISGIINLSNSANVSIGGIANINNGNLKGIQIAGIYNQTKSLKGIQIGLVNMADTINKGFSIGLISIVKKGFYDEWTISAGDYLNVGISYKAGTRSFYNIYSIGMNFFKEQLWVAGFGFGHIGEINAKFSFQPELVCYTYFPVDFSAPIRDTYATHLKLGIVRNINEKLAITFVPSLYGALKSNRGRFDTYGYEQSPIKPIGKHDARYGNSRLEIGCGFSLGLIIK